MEEIDIKSSEVVMINPANLIPYDKNMNEHSEAQIDRLCELIRYQGFRDPLIVQKGTNIVAAGHGRLEAAKKLGMRKVPVIFQEFESEAQFYAFVVSHNAIQDWSKLDLAKVNVDFIDLGPELDVDMLGLKDFAIEPIEVLEPQPDPKPKEPKTCPNCGELLK